MTEGAIYAVPPLIYRRLTARGLREHQTCSSPVPGGPRFSLLGNGLSVNRSGLYSQTACLSPLHHTGSSLCRLKPVLLLPVTALCRFYVVYYNTQKYIVNRFLQLFSALPAGVSAWSYCSTAVRTIFNITLRRVVRRRFVPCHALIGKAVCTGTETV